MRSKDHLTFTVATNASGSRKVGLSAIGKSKNPKCFRLRAPPMHYQAQTNAWRDGKCFQVWFRKVFLAHVRHVTSNKVLMLMDNTGSHMDITDPHAQVSVEFYPPNCTRLHQPMDMGIIAAVKVRYRHIFLRQSMEVFSARVELREMYKKRTPGTRGIAEGYSAHVLDAMEILDECWKELEPVSLAKYWLKERTLYPGVSKQIRDM